MLFFPQHRISHREPPTHVSSSLANGLRLTPLAPRRSRGSAPQITKMIKSNPANLFLRMSNNFFFFRNFTNQCDRREARSDSSHEHDRRACDSIALQKASDKRSFRHHYGVFYIINSRRWREPQAQAVSKTRQRLAIRAFVPKAREY